LLITFSFSCRGRHTSFSRDWSSDVCSSDLGGGDHHVLRVDVAVNDAERLALDVAERVHVLERRGHVDADPERGGDRDRTPLAPQIGRASCGESASSTVDAASAEWQADRYRT